MADTQDYVDLITAEHQDKPKFVAMIRALTAGLADTTNALLSMPNKFHLDEAEGVQLDAVGEWIGVTRYLTTPLVGVYFSWDDTTLTGWESGTWKALFDPDSGLTTLPDDAYRSLLRARAVANAWNGSMPSAAEIWEAVFGVGQTVIIQDNQDMSMIVGFVGSPLGAVQQALLTGGYIPLKPAGVRITYYAVSVDTNPLFGWDADTPVLNGWEVASWPQIISS